VVLQSVGVVSYYMTSDLRLERQVGGSPPLLFRRDFAMPPHCPNLQAVAGLIHRSS
jgi:hypothetical protein